jgi:hypothetical protein
MCDFYDDGAEIVISLSRGKTTKIDKGSFDLVKGFSWYAISCNGKFYAARSDSFAGKKKTVLLHRQLMGFPDGLEVDHIDGNGLNNTMINLRKCTHEQNIQNQKPRSSPKTSQYQGVYFQKELNKWRAQIMKDGKITHLGCFENEQEAASAYDRSALVVYGNGAKLNLKAGG